jgi:ribosome modulation factor
MKNISKQYADLLEGKMSRDNFVRNCRQQFPQFVSPVTSVDDAIKILKSKRIIAESISENTDYKDPYVKGYIDNENGRSLKDCPYDERAAAALWKNGWMDAETEKQMGHDEDTYNRETGGYGDLYKESLNEAEKTEGRWKEATGQGQYERFKDMDNVNFTTFLRAVAFEVSKDSVINDDNLPAIMEKVAKAMKKDPMAYRDLVISNTADIKKQDETLKMREVKSGNMVDKDNGMKEVKGQEKYKADSAPKTEYRKGKPEGVKEMGITPKKAPGIKDVMDMPGKEKVIDQLKEALKKSLKEDTHYNYRPGSEVETPSGFGIVKDIIGGTITVELTNGELIDYQVNMLDAIAAKKQRDDAFKSLPDLGSAGQKWLSGQVEEGMNDPKREEFKALVDKYDWYHEMSDDDRKHQAALEINKKLKALAAEIGEDIAVELFNAKAPKDRKIKSTKELREGKKDKYSKLKEYLKKAIKKEAIYQKKDQTGQTQTIVASSPKSDATLKAQKFTKISGTDDAKPTS